TATTTTFKYEKHKASFAGYTTPGFRIKIDAETMIVNSNVLDASGDWGTLTVTRGTQATTGTVAAAHPAGAAIMIYNNAGLGIDEYTPLTSLFSSLQHVVEATGDVDPTFTEHRTEFTPHKDCWRYKRVFTRIQVAREALCDVITAKNKLLRAANLVAAATDVAPDLTYDSFSARTDFLAMAAPFYIKVSDPDNSGSDEIMLVTAHDPDTSNLTVTRGQRDTSACAHASDSIISTYSGTRDLVRFGIFTFSTQAADSPANKLVDLNDFGQKNTDGTYKAAAYINDAILDNIGGDAINPATNPVNPVILARGSTPLARALTYVWNYLKPNTGANYINTSDWKAVDKDTFGTAEKFQTLPGATHVSPIGSPMEYWCQENFAVMITDGEATADSGYMGYGVFSQGSRKTALCGNISSDFTKFDYNRSSYPTPWGDTVNDGSEYLTDVAYFLSHQDMFPTTRIITGHWNTTQEPVTNIRNNFYDSGTAEADGENLYHESDTDVYKEWPGNQNIKTYTVGLCVSNTVLPKAAKNGGGASFTASNYRDLSDAFLNIITSVELAQQPMTYTTYAAPKQSITGGNYGYVAHFIPRLRTMWEGHLRRYRLGDDGSFPDNIDNPAATVVVGGANVVSFQWNAGVILNGRTTARVVYTSKPSSGSWPRLDFMGSSITAADLDVTSGQVALVKNFIQNFNKADGIDANSEYNGLYRLGETFHFNPQLVGYPLSWKANFDLSYKSFYEQYGAGGAAPRAEVVYAGANDGKLHCFQASNGNELWSYVPFAHLKKLKDKLVYNPLKHTYFNDGKSLVKDIKVAKSDGTFYNDYRDWKTGLFFGMGIGGRSYCALDVTTPADLKILWETDEDAETTADGRMGFTEAKPVVVDMNGGSTLGNFPAVILPGGYNACEEKATEMSVLPWQRREGKALYILNADTGALVKKFIYGASLTETGNASTGYIETNPGFLTAMTAAPTVLDKNNDGLADVIYLAESGDYRVANTYGGAIWKINCYGDPANWVAQKIYQADDGQTIFVSPSLAYDNDYRVWVMFGTGRRSQPAEGLGTGSGFTNLTGQFVAFIDDNSGTIITNADLHEAVTAGDTEYTIDNSGTVKKGFWFTFHLAHEIMYEPQPLYINSQVYFMTFTPQEGTGSPGGEICGGSSSVNGSHYIYQFKLNSTGNTFILGDFLIQAGKILGFGPMGDKFIIYVGAGDAGNFKPNAGAGGMVTFTIENKNSTMFWKEDKK
ncbi:MAG: PilC/PilY family type IV pilus protein, partial [Candidatus Aminicenantes bacterium]|nr:PilC/PilY family type IV pilus protein [Candidatus Aminicenantes bacterium]